MGFSSRIVSSGDFGGGDACLGTYGDMDKSMMGNEIEPFDVDQFFSENARRRNRANLAERLADWIRDYGDRAPWDEAGGDEPVKAKKTKANTTLKSKKEKKGFSGKTSPEKPSSNNSEPKSTTTSASNTTPEGLVTAFDGNDSGLFSSQLYRLLDRSGAAISARREELREGGRSVLYAINERADADITQVANMFRVWIGVLWGGIAAWLYVQSTNAKIAGVAETASGIPVAEASVMMSIFALLGSLAAASGVATLGIGAARNAFSNEEFIRASENYGGWIAKTLADFDARLLSHRRKLSDKSLSNEEVLQEVSEAHLTAEEAAILFNEVGFLVEGEDEPKKSAMRSFTKYLNDCGLVSPSVAKSGILAGGILGLFGGVFLGAVMGSLVLLEVLGVSPGLLLDKLGIQALRGFDKYPYALMAIIVPACLLVTAGSIGELLVTAFMSRPRSLRLRDSLQAIRGAITAAQAPRARDIAQRVEDLSEIFRIRLAKVSSGGGNFANDPVETPSWRDRDDSPRFVNTGFASAPKPFLADPANARNAKKFAPVREAKRGLFGLGKPRRP